MKAKKMQPIRQGDVCLIPVEKLPTNAIESTHDGKRIVLAYGEVTGHAHAIYDTTKARLWDVGVERFLQVLAPVSLAHEEHTHVTLQPGIYHLPRQVEYTPAELKRVTD